MQGIFITFEGNDGSGKTTISTMVYEELKKQGLPVIYTREPGGIDIAEQIRSIILDPKNTAMDARTEALLYAAARRQHLIEKILPALEAGCIVICDRFLDSSLAYQGFGRKLGLEEVLKINEFAIEGRLPDATIFLTLSAEEGLKRIENRTNKDRLDIEDISFHFEVAKGYETVRMMFKERMREVDANHSIQQVFKDSLKQVLDVIHHVQG